MFLLLHEHGAGHGCTRLIKLRFAAWNGCPTGPQIWNSSRLSRTVWSSALLPSANLCSFKLFYRPVSFINPFAQPTPKACPLSSTASLCLSPKKPPLLLLPPFSLSHTKFTAFLTMLALHKLQVRGSLNPSLGAAQPISAERAIAGRRGADAHSLSLSHTQSPLRPWARQFCTARALRKSSPTVLAPNSVSALALRNLNSSYVGQRDYNSQSVEAPEAFYGGVLGKVRNMADMSHENEAGLPSTGREDALIGVTAAQKWAAGDETIVPSRHIFNEFSMVRFLSSVCSLKFVQLSDSNLLRSNNRTSVWAL